MNNSISKLENKIKGRLPELFTTRKLSRIFWLICIVLTIVACMKTLWISLDIDESYAIAVGYRLATGEKLFQDLWESHQLGGVYLAPFIWVYLKVVGTTTYIVLYSRIVGTVLQLLIGVFLVRTFRNNLPQWMLMMLFMLHMNFMPKWVQTPEFELIQYWFILLMFCTLYRFFAFEGYHIRWLFISGMLLVGQMMLYPTLFILYPLYLCGIIMCGKHKKREKGQIIRDAIIFTLGAFIPGILFLLYLASYMSVSELFDNISHIMQDESHTLVSTSVKWKIYFASFREIGIKIIVVFAISGIVAYFSGKGRQLIARMCLLVFLILGMMQLYGVLFADENQFYMLWRYMAYGICGIVLYLVQKDNYEHKSENQIIFWFAVLPGFITVLAVLIITNMDINTTAAKMFISVIGAILLLYRERKKRGIIIFLVFCMLFGNLLFGKLIQMRITGCGPITILAPMEQIEEGPAKGIYMISDTAKILNDDYEVIKSQNLTSEDKLLYIGGENLIYLWTDAQLATPSTQGTNAYNQEFVSYFEEHPDKMPTVIVIDKQMGVDPVYYNSDKNYILFDWIDENYGDATIEQSDYLTIYRR